MPHPGAPVSVSPLVPFQLPSDTAASARSCRAVSSRACWAAIHALVTDEEAAARLPWS
ncbi:hypothetical protein ACWGDS_19370 [Streptomyces sp. NPDC055059]|uniref:hypothetical protein n=1 Tax=Streptomyces sp. NPDC127172 TaxID=3345382 RepID=UPI003635CD8F